LLAAVVDVVHGFIPGAGTLNNPCRMERNKLQQCCLDATNAESEVKWLIAESLPNARHGGKRSMDCAVGTASI
jgi:hypothetical protein